MSKSVYVIFDADNDRWAFARMKGWKALSSIDFDFDNVHEVNVLRDWSSEETVKRKLRERFKYAECAIVLIGAYTRNLYRYVRWELEVALDLDLPIIAVNLNGERELDEVLCPPVIRDEYVVHVPFKMAIIKFAVDEFPWSYRRRTEGETGSRHYPAKIYKQLGVD